MLETLSQLRRSGRITENVVTYKKSTYRWNGEDYWICEDDSSISERTYTDKEIKQFISLTAISVHEFVASIEAARCLTNIRLSGDIEHEFVLFELQSGWHHVFIWKHSRYIHYDAFKKDIDKRKQYKIVYYPQDFMLVVK